MLGVGLTQEPETAKLERLPREPAGRPDIGVRPLLENSTACQKSMPKNPVPGVGGRPSGLCAHQDRIPLVKTDDSNV